MTTLNDWIGATLSTPTRSPTVFCGWREDACCGGQPDLYLSGAEWGLIVDAPWHLDVDGDTLTISSEGEAVILSRSPSSTS